MIPVPASEIAGAVLALILRLLIFIPDPGGCRRSFAVSMLLSSMSSVTKEVRVGVHARVLTPDVGLTEGSQNHV